MIVVVFYWSLLCDWLHTVIRVEKSLQEGVKLNFDKKYEMLEIKTNKAKTNQNKLQLYILYVECNKRLLAIGLCAFTSSRHELKSYVIQLLFQVSVIQEERHKTSAAPVPSLLNDSKHKNSKYISP